MTMAEAEAGIAEGSQQGRTQARIVLRPYASAIPLGAFAFGIGNVLYSAFLLHWIASSESLLLAVMLLAFVAPLELLPCVMAYLSRDTGGATAFGIFGAAWVVQGIQLLLPGANQPSVASGIFLASLALCLAILSVITFPGKPLIGSLLVVAVLRTVGAALMEFAFGHSIATISAILGLVLALFAFYSGVAFLDEDVRQVISPLTFRTGAARAAMEGSLEEQIEPLSREAGIRKQL